MWMRKETYKSYSGRFGHLEVGRNSACLTYPFSGCGNLVPAPAHTTSGETLTTAERASSIGVCWQTLNSKPGSGPLEPTNGSIIGTWSILRKGSGNDKRLLEA